MLYVERAGLFLGFLIAKQLKCSISGIYSRRNYDSVKNKSKKILRQLPRFITHLLREIELNSSLHFIKRKRFVHINQGYPPTNKNILIVDDAIDTGVTLQTVQDFLLLKGYTRDHLRTAVLTTTSKNSQFKADICLFKQKVFAYPWSYDSVNYNEAQEIYRKLKDIVSEKANS